MITTRHGKDKDFAGAHCSSKRRTMLESNKFPGRGCSLIPAGTVQFVTPSKSNGGSTRVQKC